MFSQACIIPSVHFGGGCLAKGGGMRGRGVWVAGSVHGSGGMCVGGGACMAGGSVHAGETAT